MHVDHGLTGTNRDPIRVCLDQLRHRQPVSERLETQTFGRVPHRPAGDMLTNYTAGYSPAAAIDVCAGDVDLSVFKGKPATLDLIAGYELGRCGPGVPGG